ncbi:hypothetical protein LMG27952_02966 [Paraburkholderia hiiakae]|uniref:Uncharacterized protein n=1 Tax=Paraburkholderia hiiakae TaxID=1081782 RepID=A0ABN7HT99_9BURK|nr:hypothetical protein LMG27952_02966 [Paraburkholderia hiiakae]
MNEDNQTHARRPKKTLFSMYYYRNGDKFHSTYQGYFNDHRKKS